MKLGDRVRMSEALKQLLRGTDSVDHLNEFGGCVGVIVGPTFEDDMTILDVRWQPSDLRYGYVVDHPDYACQLEVVHEGFEVCPSCQAPAAKHRGTLRFKHTAVCEIGLLKRRRVTCPKCTTRIRYDDRMWQDGAWEARLECPTCWVMAESGASPPSPHT